MLCKNCGASFETGSLFCPMCGAGTGNSEALNETVNRPTEQANEIPNTNESEQPSNSVKENAFGYSQPIPNAIPPQYSSSDIQPQPAVQGVSPYIPPLQPQYMSQQILPPEPPKKKEYFGKGALAFCVTVIAVLSIACGVFAGLYFGQLKRNSITVAPFINEVMDNGQY